MNPEDSVVVERKTVITVVQTIAASEVCDDRPDPTVERERKARRVARTIARRRKSEP